MWANAPHRPFLASIWAARPGRVAKRSERAASKTASLPAITRPPSGLVIPKKISKILRRLRVVQYGIRITPARRPIRASVWTGTRP